MPEYRNPLMLTPEQQAERARLTKEILDELLNEEAVAELATLRLEPRASLGAGYVESDFQFMLRADNCRAAALLLRIYMRTIRGMQP